MRLALQAFALALSVACLAPSGSALADPPELESRVRVLGPAREGEGDLYAQIGRALEAAQVASGEGQSARAARHRDLALALVRGLEARRRVAELRARLSERRAAIEAARVRLERARAASTQGEVDRARVESP
jgi:hypothetical protein